MAQTPMYAAIANSPGTELSANISDTDTTIAVLDASKLPAAPNLFTVGNDETAETIRYTGKSGNNLTGCTRGFNGTTAKGWSTGAKVARNFTGYDHDTFIANIGDLDQRVTAAQTKADAAETPAGSQAKANAAEANANAHSDGLVGTLSNLLTTNKTNTVAAINELFTNANSLKSDWAGVIGSPLSSTDTSAQLKSKTQTIKNTLATNLTNKGQSSVGTETLDALAAKVANVSTGKKYATGNATSASSTEFFYKADGTQVPLYSVTVGGISFKPSHIVLFKYNTSDPYPVSYDKDYIINNGNGVISIGTADGYRDQVPAYINTTGFKLPVPASNTNYVWKAFE